VISFRETADGNGLSIVDDIERRQFRFEADEPITHTPTDVSDFYFPVDEAVALDTERVHLPNLVATYVRDDDGTMLEEVGPLSVSEFDEGTYSVEICGPVKIYLRVDGPLTVSAGVDELTIEAASHVRVGGRSHHKHPEATITTTAEPRDLMRAVSALGSALKTTSPERSYPTLRGHPPTIELGDELDVPDVLEPPRTGVRIELPPNVSYIYPAASLSYYLGARIVPGRRPRLVTDEGYTYRLDGVHDYEETVERVLKHVFTLDCVTRTEGYYNVDLHERTGVEENVDVDFARLYELSPSERLVEYLEIPFDAVEEQIPAWKLTTHVAPTDENVELLPFLVNDLAAIRMPAGQTVTASEAQMAAINDFTRGDAFTRSAAGTRSTTRGIGTPSLVQPETADSIEQAWAGENAPVGASKASVQAYRNKLEREVSEGDIEITVVCNDNAMEEEQDIAAEVYGSREEFPFEVNIYRDLSKAALKAVLETEMDFLHYIGHIDEDGFQCSDGRLDAHELDHVGVDAFLLNACRSYEQGMALIERGAIGGVVTLAEVINSGAVRVGRTMVRLLNQGFPLRPALDIAKDRSIVGGQYIVVGDGNVDVVQLEAGVPVLFELTELPGKRFEVTPKAYPTESRNIGTMTRVLWNENVHYISSGELSRWTLAHDELWQVLEQEAKPVVIDGEFKWSDEIEVGDL
jgi:hypothetical protein